MKKRQDIDHQFVSITTNDINMDASSRRLAKEHHEGPHSLSHHWIVGPSDRQTARPPDRVIPKAMG